MITPSWFPKKLFRVHDFACACSTLLLAGMATLLSGCVFINAGSDHKCATEGALAGSIDFKDPVLNQRKIMVTTMLNEPTARGIILKLQYLNSLGADPIDLYLDTDGGPIQNAFAIIDVMRSLKAPVNTWAVGNCNSGGAMVLVAGTGRRLAFPNAVIAVHGGKPVGKVPKAYLGIVDRQVETLWKQRAKLPDGWFPLRGDVTHFLAADEALQYGVIDEIAKPQK